MKSFSVFCIMAIAVFNFVTAGHKSIATEDYMKCVRENCQLNLYLAKEMLMGNLNNPKYLGIALSTAGKNQFLGCQFKYDSGRVKFLFDLNANEYNQVIDCLVNKDKYLFLSKILEKSQFYQCSRNNNCDQFQTKVPTGKDKIVSSVKKAVKSCTGANCD